MTVFARRGGITGGRPIDRADPFEAAVEHVLGERLRRAADTCCALWAALANVRWEQTDGDTAGFTYRAAGDLVAAMRGEGDYLDWYCSAQAGVVRPDIAEAMAREGWRPIKG